MRNPGHLLSRVLRVAIVALSVLGAGSGCARCAATPSEPPESPESSAAAVATPAVTMEEFEGDFAPLFPRPAFLRSRGVEEVVAVSQALVEGAPVGSVRQVSRRYDSAGELVEQRETEDGKPLRVHRHERDANGGGREILEDMVWATTTTTTVTRDAKGRTLTRTNERERERYSYVGDELILVEREESGRKLAKRFRYRGGHVIAVVIEQDGVVIQNETRELDAKGREVRRVTTKRDVHAPVEVRVSYTANDEIDSLEITEGKPLLHVTFRYERGNLVEEQRQSFVPAVGDERTTFSYRFRAN